MPSNRELDVEVAKFELVFENLPLIITGTLCAAVALLVFLADVVPSVVLMSWFSFIFFWTLLRAYMWRRWHKNPTTRANVKRRSVQAALLSFVLASAFGFFAAYGVNVDFPFANLLLMMIISGMVASATGSTSFLLPMYILFVIPLILPVSIRMLFLDNTVYYWISALAMVFLAVCASSSRSVSSAISESINIRFDNDDLLENLRLEKQRAEEALTREANANQAKSKFLAAASHDLRQPMHSLRLFTATLELQTRDTRHKTLVSQIDSSVKSLEDLFNALLDISKLDAGTLPVNFEHVSLVPVLQHIESDFEPLAAEKGIAFKCEGIDCVVFTDSLLLERLLRNLLSNAVRYTRSGWVKLASEVEGDSVRISVTDTGPGISKDNHTRVFDEFVQLESDGHHRGEGEGIGLGLSIVKRLSLLLDIPVTLVSNPGFGTTFSVKVPLGEALRVDSADGAVVLSNDAVDSLFVLVIDDEYDTCLAIEGLLETWGCVVMTAISGDAALEQLEEIGEIPDVIVSDYRLRDQETGGDAISRVRQFLKKDIPAIVLTGDIAPDRLKDIKQLGFPMLHKPCEPDTLRHLLARQTKNTGHG